MDEFRRRQSVGDFLEEERALTTSKKKWKRTSGQWCNYCEVSSHSTNKCWILHPSRRPKKTKDRVEKPRQPNKVKKSNQSKEKVLVVLSPDNQTPEDSQPGNNLVE